MAQGVVGGQRFQLPIGITSVQASDSGISGILTNPRQAEAAVANIFRGPNIAALTAPPIMQELYQSVQGTSEMFAALETPISQWLLAMIG
jgi:hypothetical protein